MKFDEEKKKSIRLYLLEKIKQDNTSISKSVAETFEVNQNTVHSYINDLVNENVIRRVQRGKYELISEKTVYNLKRSNGDLSTDTYAYDFCLKQFIENFQKNVIEIWAYTFSEMINNVMDHSLAENVQIIIEQDYLNTTVIIRDDGVGIFEKIKEHFSLPSLDEAICELFKGKLTTDSENHSGEGIFFSSKMMDDFFIISSERIFSNNRYDNSRIIELVEKKYPGTCVIMSLSNFSHKQSYEVFDLYSNVEGGFTKTKIPLKNIFDSSPVSRSQAKRVCNRLDKFKEVIFDFEGVDWMGQGFAHQLFVVFKYEHPEISFIPINMNEAITKMYNHVQNTDI
ncbi:MAG: DUF4325 domain-containing protein [Lachnospiraceae bacterium]|nr:DUF4325 domain-containing protein [Lachnospiraceae bacterium]